MMRPVVDRTARFWSGWPGAAIASVFILTLAPNVARAQTAPAPAPSPSAAPGPAGGGNASPANPGGVAAAPRTAPIGHLPVLDFIPTFTQPLDYVNSTQTKGYQPFDVGGTARIPVTRDFSLYFDRVIGGTLDVPLARVLIPVPGRPSAVVLPGVSRDIVLFYHGTYRFNRYLSLDVGDAFRHRAFNSGSSGVSGAPFPASVSSTEAHWGYAGLVYSTHPVRGLLNSVFTFTEQVQAQNVDHRVGVLCTAANAVARTFGCTAPGTVGYQDENPNQNRYYTTSQTVGVTVPIDAKHFTLLSFQDLWGGLSWYENAPFPYRYTGVEQLLLSKRFSPGFTLGLRARQYYQIPQGAPFPVPNVIHLGSLDVVGTFHLDTNTLFH